MAAPVSRIDIVGAGPAGLYTAILARLRLPGVAVRILERNPRGTTFGFGVVFSDRALDFQNADAPELHQLVVPEMEHWRNMPLNLSSACNTESLASGVKTAISVIRAGDMPMQRIS